MMLLSPAIQSIIFGVSTKSIGSIFRLVDDWKAPAPVRNNTALREGLLLGLTTVFTALTQTVFTRQISPLLQKHPKILPYELLLRAGAASLGVLMAELASRATAPKTKWTDYLELNNSRQSSDLVVPALFKAPSTLPLFPQPGTLPLRTPLTFATVAPRRYPAPFGTASVFRGTFSI